MKSVVIPLGIEPLPKPEGEAPDAAAPPNSFLAQYPQLAGTRIVLYLSRLDPKKNVEGMLKAFSLLGRPDEANPPSTLSRVVWEAWG